MPKADVIWGFWNVVLLSLPVRDVERIEVLSTEPVRICFLRVWLPMVDAVSPWFILGNSSVHSYFTSLGIPVASTTSPALRPEPHHRSKLIPSRVMATVFLVLVFSELLVTTPIRANHHSVLLD